MGRQPPLHDLDSALARPPEGDSTHCPYPAKVQDDVSKNAVGDVSHAVDDVCVDQLQEAVNCPDDSERKDEEGQDSRCARVEDLVLLVLIVLLFAVMARGVGIVGEEFV
jgi:hypothetical protein